MRDNIILSDGTDIVIVNQYSCCELFKWLIVEYAGVSYQQANACVETRIPFFEGIDTFCLLLCTVTTGPITIPRWICILAIIFLKMLSCHLLIHRKGLLYMRTLRLASSGSTT